MSKTNDEIDDKIKKHFILQPRAGPVRTRYFENFKTICRFVNWIRTLYKHSVVTVCGLLVA